MTRMPRLLVVSICLAMGVSGCSGCIENPHGTPDGGVSNGGSDTDSNGNGIDTAEFDGTAAWTIGPRSGIVVRELSTNEIYLEEHKRGELDELPAQPFLSRDRSTLAYVRDNTEQATVIGQVYKRTLGTGEEVAVPIEIPDSEDDRLSTVPTTTADGSVVALTQYRATPDQQGFYLDIKPADIALWDGGGEPTVIAADGEAEDFKPHISADGSRVLFVSDRSGELDFYMVPADDSEGPERIGYDNYTKRLSDVWFELDNGWAVSDDLAYIAYAARIPDETSRGAFLLETSSGDIQRLGDSGDVLAVDISGDGSTVAVTSTGSNANNTIVATLELFDVSDPSSGETISESVQTAQYHKAELNQDGSVVILAKTGGEDFEGSQHLVLMNSDGSNRTLLDNEHGETGLSLQSFNLDFR